MTDSRKLTPVALQREIDANRRSERWVILKAVIALSAVAVLVIIRQVFFV